RRRAGARVAATRGAVQQLRVSLAENGRGPRIPGRLGGALEAVRRIVDHAAPRLPRARARVRRPRRNGRAASGGPRRAAARTRRRRGGKPRAGRDGARADLAVKTSAALLAASLASAAYAQSPEDLAEGLRLYTQKGNCQACHGWAGDGRKMDSQMPDGAN